MTTKVFIINRGGHDFSQAKKYGELVFLSEGTINKYAITDMYRKFSGLLRDSSPDDYILLTGPTTMCVVACSVFAFLHKKLNVLLFKDGAYQERTLMLDELLGKKDVEGWRKP